MKRLFAAAMLFLLSIPLQADTLKDWAEGYQSADVQKKILTRIISGVSKGETMQQDKESGMYLFPTNGNWVRLSSDFVWSPPTPAEGLAYLVVSCIVYQRLDRPPVTTTSYLLRNVDDKPLALTAGYADIEHVQVAHLKELNRRFLVVTQYSQDYGKGQTGAFLLQLNASLSESRPRTVWQSPHSARKFHFGFDKLAGRYEQLVLRVQRNDEVSYSAYRWNGDRFEPDSFASETRLKALPDDVWKYGSGR